MDIKMGGQVFGNVQIPLLWGVRAVIEDEKKRLSVIDLGGKSARLEIVGDLPAPGVEFRPTAEGIEILGQGTPLYEFSAQERLLRSISLDLPDCRIGANEITVGTNVFSGNQFVGHGVGIAISKSGISVGAPLPKSLAELVV